MDNQNLVNHPNHYNTGKIECVDGLQSILSSEAFEGFLQGNCIKYLWRWKYKGGVQDLKKCKWYLEKLIDYIETK